MHWLAHVSSHIFDAVEMLRSVGTEFKVMQELLRHSTLRSTLDVYTQAITPAKHAAQAAVWSLVFSHEANGTKESPSSADVAA
jgi:site-specific recombinase XerD